MKTFNLSLATVVVGALAVSYSACSAQGQDNTQPRPADGAGSPSTAAGGPSGTAGSGAIPAAGSGTGGTPQTGSAGSAPVATGGKFNTGIGGAFVSAGAPGKGGSGPTGGAGAPPATGSCKTAAGTLTEVLIDDLEDGDNVIQPIGSRVGYWYTYNDGTGTQVPAPSVLFKGTAPGSTATPKFAATTSGPAFTSYGAGMGFDFNNTAKKSCPYNASVYTGIKFWAKANTGNMTGMTLKAMIKIPATTPTTADGGTCAAKCEDHFFLKPAPALTATWTQYTMPFASIAQDGFGTAATFDKTSLLGVQFQVAASVAFNFSIDDITFY